MTTVGLGWQLLVALVCLGADDPWKFQGALEFRSAVYFQKSSPADTYLQAASSLFLSVQHRSNTWGRVVVSADLEIDTHHDVGRTRFVDWNNRDLRSAAFRPRECFWEYKTGPWDLRFGRQEIRWGRADTVNPTDNLEPYDFLNPFLNLRLPTTAAKADLYLGAEHLEVLWMPFFEPSRLPLLGQRWFPRIPSELQIGGSTQRFDIHDGDRRYPPLRLRNSQAGVRWNHTLHGGEFSVSYFDGINDLPFYSVRLGLIQPLQVWLDRDYHRQRVIGADFASSLGVFGVRGEAAYVPRTDAREDSYFSYVLGIDRQLGRWFTIVEFAGQWVSRRGSAPQLTSFDRGLGYALVVRTQYDLRTDEALELLALMRLPSGDSAWRITYTRKLADRWQVELRASAFSGNHHAFLGQFQDSDSASTKLTYRW